MKYPFIGRETELEDLKSLYERSKPTLAVIKGRRRIGKSALVDHFAQKNLLKGSRFFSFAGLAPTQNITAQSQRDHFSQQLSDALGVPFSKFDDWTQTLNHFTEFISPGDIILLDEISWMGSLDPTFIPKLKVWWDVISAQKDHFMLIFCGSVSTWIEENILKSTAFFGRISLTISLESFLIPESTQFLKAIGFKGSSHEIYEILSILGGIPWYLEQINPKIMGEENIKNLCFKKNGLLVSEFNHIFHDIFNGKGTTYKKILNSLKDGMKTLSEIREEIQFSQSGTLSLLIDHLISSGFIKEHYQWSIKTENILKHKLYRILDPFTRFYLKNMEHNLIKISESGFNSLNLKYLPGFEANMGLQVENLLLQNRTLILRSLGIDPLDCIFDGPYLQKKTLKTKGCQIDYLIQTRTQNLFLCEFKFNRSILGSDIIHEVEQKMKRLSIPRGYALVPVLFHMGEVSGAVYDKRYFYKIINIQDFVD